MSNIETITGCSALMEACTLELYQKNIFRITGLPVDATTKEIARQAQKLQMLEEMGGGAGGNHPAFSPATAPATDEIRAALSRMKEAEHRIVDEFFWYWPEASSDSKNDPAIQAILAGDADTAITLWRHRENEGSHIAKHNMAVMYHMFAVDWTNYQTLHDLDPETQDEVKRYWRKAFGRWEELVDSDVVKQVLKQRIQAYGDEALTTGFVRRLLKQLPQALDQINAEAALKLAERKRMDWAQFHVEFMRETHQGLDDVESTAELILTPTRKRVEQRLRSTRKQSEDRPAEGPALASGLMSDCHPWMSLFDLFHGEDSHQRADLFDEVAQTVADILVSYQKTTGDNRAFVDLLQKALVFATGTQIRERLIKNIAIGESNLASEELEPFFGRLNELMASKDSPAAKLRRLQTQILPQLPELASKIGTSGPVYDDLRDSVALALRELSIEAHNSHQDLETAEKSILLAKNLAASQELLTRINADLATLTENKRLAVCFYCDKAPASKEATHHLAMYGDVVRSYGRVNYRKGSVAIPRCPECKQKQDLSSTTGCLLWIACIVIGAMLMGEDLWFLGAILGGVAGWVISLIVPLFMSSSQLKSPKKHPEVSRLLRSGWSIGDSPGRYG